MSNSQIQWEIIIWAGELGDASTYKWKITHIVFERKTQWVVWGGGGHNNGEWVHMRLGQIEE